MYDVLNVIAPDRRTNMGISCIICVDADERVPAIALSFSKLAAAVLTANLHSLFPVIQTLAQSFNRLPFALVLAKAQILVRNCQKCTKKEDIKNCQDLIICVAALGYF
eukprot:5520415-Pleurochrysis_carterae.AAC.2